MKRAGFAVFGYLLFLFGMISLILSMIGLVFTPLAFLDSFGSLTGFVLRLIFVFGGIVILYVARVSRE